MMISRSRWGNAVLFIFLAVVAVIMALPLYYAIITALKPMDELFYYPPRFYVVRPSLKNFADLTSVLGTSYVPFMRYVFNSIVITVVATFGHIIFAAMAAYPLSKNKNLRSRGVIFEIIVLSLMFSGYVLAIPRYLVMNYIGILNTYWALILPAMSGTMGLYLLKNFMEQIPDAMIEAARIDGAKELRILWSIVMPMVKPAWLTLLLLLVQSIWNDGGSSALYIYNESLKAMPVLQSYVSAAGFTRTGAASAFSLVMMIPPVATFVISQSNVIETMKSAGLKE